MYIGVIQSASIPRPVAMRLHLSIPTLTPTFSQVPMPTPLTQVSIALDWFPWSNHSGLFVAQERGYFADECLDVNIFTPGDPSTVGDHSDQRPLPN